MKILSVTPIAVSEVELKRRQARYNRLCPAGVSVQLLNLADNGNVPVALQTTDDIQRSEEAIFARFATENLTGYDALMPDCVLDPCVDLEEPELDLPVLGLLKLNAHHFAGLGLTVGAVVRNETIGAELARKFQTYGAGDLAGRPQVMGLSVEDISDESKWAHAVAECLAGCEADVILNGCSAVETKGSVGSPGLVDPAGLALELLALLPKLSTRQEG